MNNMVSEIILYQERELEQRKVFAETELLGLSGSSYAI